MNKSFLMPAAAVLCGLSPLSFAGDVQLQPLLVTASRTTQTASQALAAVTVITRSQIEQQQASSVPEVLRNVPGVTLANNGGPGKSTSLFLRGTESDHVLVLIDGMQIGSATTGTAALQDLPLELIERIEVVRGPRSSLYGSEAIGGVIQIFTRRDGGAGLRPFLSLGTGTHDSHSGSAGLSGRSGQSWFNLGVTSSDTDGINVKSAGSRGYEDDSDGYRNLSVALRAGHRFSNGLELDATLLQADSHNDYDSVNSRRTSGFHAHADGEQKVAGLRARFSPFDSWQVSLQAGRSEDKSDTYQDGAFDSRFDTRRDSLSWQNEIELAEGHALLAGIDHQREEINGTTAYAEDSRENDGYFLQYLGGAGRHDWQLAVRRDDNQQFGDHETGSLAYGYALTESLRGYVSYGSAFKAPTFNELYYPGYGNAELDAETSRSLEAGLQGQQGWGQWEVAAFRTAIDNLIAYDASRSAPNNIDQALIKGVELSATGQWLGFDLSGNLTWQQPKSHSGGANDGNELARRAGQILNLALDRRFERLSLGASLHAEGQRYDDLANSTELAGFATLDLRAEYLLDDEWRVQAKVSNLLDADYETAAGYIQPGQAVQLTVRYQAL